MRLVFGGSITPSLELHNQAVILCIYWLAGGCKALQWGPSLARTKTAHAPPPRSMAIGNSTLWTPAGATPKHMELSENKDPYLAGIRATTSQTPKEITAKGESYSQPRVVPPQGSLPCQPHSRVHTMQLKDPCYTEFSFSRTQPIKKPSHKGAGANMLFERYCVCVCVLGSNL